MRLLLLLALAAAAAHARTLDTAPVIEAPATTRAWSPSEAPLPSAAAPAPAPPTSHPHAELLRTSSPPLPAVLQDEAVTDETAVTAALNEGPSFLPPARHAIILERTEDQLHYRFNLSLGTPPQTVSLILDTGSGDMVVFPTSFCTSPQWSSGRRAGPCFRVNDSTTLLPTNVDSAQRAAYSLLIDGETLTSVSPHWPVVQDMLGVNSIPIGQSIAAVPSPRVNVNFLLTQSLRLISSTTSPLHTFNFSHGIIGAGYPGTSLLGSPLLALFDTFPYHPDDASPFAPVFSLDLNPGSASWLFVQGIREEFRDRLVWGTPGTSSALHEFTIFDLRLCGASLFGNFTNSVSAFVDTGAACLQLPAEVYDALFSWIPAECDNSNVCSPPAGFTEALPTLSFRLSEGGPELFLPLSRLVLNSIGEIRPRSRFCVVRGDSLSRRSFRSRISFGSMPASAFFLVFDMLAVQVGFANKAALASSNVHCRQVRQCVGMQTRSPQFNICLDPPCADYFFFSLDDATKTCYLRPSFFAASLTLALIFLVFELLFNEAQVWVARKITQGVEPS